MFEPYPDLDGRRWLPVDQAAKAMGTTPEQVVVAVRQGLLRWTVTADGVPMVEPAIVTRHGPPGTA